MASLVHCVYASASSRSMGQSELEKLLLQSREKNARHDITGMLLYTEGSFFQVMEGPAFAVAALFARIQCDGRHEHVTEILSEPIVKRSFDQWTMGFSALTREELATVEGMNDFFGGSRSFGAIDAGRAKKLLSTFRDGRWRQRVSLGLPAKKADLDSTAASTSVKRSAVQPGEAQSQLFTYAYQPIVDVTSKTIFSYEALIRGSENEPASHVFREISAASKHQFDQDSRVHAIKLAAKLGITCNLNLNFLPEALNVSPETILSTMKAAALYNLPLQQIILEVTEGEVISNPVHFAALLNEYRAIGLRIAVDDFGAGYAGLNLLADFQPDQIKIDMNLVRGIDKHGPRQAIVRAVSQACSDLGVEIIAEGVETVEEYAWFADHGIHLFQGYLFGRPSFERLSSAYFPARAVDPPVSAESLRSQVLPSSRADAIRRAKP